MSMLGAPVGPGTEPGLFDAKKSVLRSGEIFGSCSFAVAWFTAGPSFTAADHGASRWARVAE
jgi:hypothetical protein